MPIGVSWSVEPSDPTYSKTFIVARLTYMNISFEQTIAVRVVCLELIDTKSVDLGRFT
jgi:hypothetical protein